MPTDSWQYPVTIYDFHQIHDIMDPIHDMLDPLHDIMDTFFQKIASNWIELVSSKLKNLILFQIVKIFFV